MAHPFTLLHAPCDLQDEPFPRGIQGPSQTDPSLLPTSPSSQIIGPTPAIPTWTVSVRLRHTNREAGVV